MINIIKTKLITAAEESGFTFLESFNAGNMIDNTSSRDYLCLFNVNSQEYSSKIISANSAFYGIECTFDISIRMFGKRDNFSDYNKLEDAVSKFLEFIGLNTSLVVVKINRSEINRNNLLGRLESNVTAHLKCLVVNEGGV